MNKALQKLDNPVWYSLTENHANFAINYQGCYFYHPDYCPFGGFVDLSATSNACNEYSKLTDNFFIVGNQPDVQGSVKINQALVCDQMILSSPIDIEINAEIIELQINHHEDLFNLVNLVQPGYFKRQTPQLGSYYGIFKNGQLVAAAGERMKMSTHTEISAVVTHPEYTGRGYATQLIAHAGKQVFNADKIPFLHVAEDNIGAIKLYEKLGFWSRRKISFWSLSL